MKFSHKNYFKTALLAAGLALSATASIASGATAGPTASRAIDPTFGPEFEFTHPEMEKSSDLAAEGRWADRLAQVVERKCAAYECRIQWHRGKYDTPEARVVFPDGYWFNISLDPHVVEIQAKPLTLAELKEKTNLMNELIFASAREIGIAPTPRRAGHFNIGLMSAFGGDPDEFLKFFIDYARHAELASGILRENYRTAPPLAVLEPAQHEALNRILQERRKGKLTTLKAVLERIVRSVYTENLAPMSDEPASHNQAINLDAAMTHEFPKKDKQLEIRAVRAQRNAEDFILLAELFSARIRHLRTQPLPERFDAPHIQDAAWVDKVEAFRRYIAETGLDPARFMPLVPRSAPWPRQCADIFPLRP